MLINKDLKNRKKELIVFFRKYAHDVIIELKQYAYKEKAQQCNRALKNIKEKLIEDIVFKANEERWATKDLLETILMVTYTNYVVMLESRNSIWEYDYMAFSRRIGELWEPFCKICFLYPVRELQLYTPPVFSEVKEKLTCTIEEYIKTLNISEQQQSQLRRYYNIVWGLVTSGEIKLECDLHFIQNGKKYVVDFKSGFGSNEKGNTNRLLLVGNIYKNIDNKYQCEIFVRATENNHYLQTLEHSNIWNIYCGDNTYNAIKKYSGYDLQKWILNNISWLNDFKPEMKKHIIENNLSSYLQW